LVIAVEDLHWIDKSSEKSLKNLLNSISGACILLIFTYRTDYEPIWGGRSYHSQITLNRLSNKESLAVVTHFMGTGVIDSDIANMILEKTEGVPFFIEEFIKSLKDLKIIEEKKKTYHLAKDFQDITIPSTIQDVIMARVDSLPEGAKELLQTGSVIEREFSYELIKLVTGLSGRELLTHLSALKDSELLYERGIYPESTYIFKHALAQEVVFDSILTKRKKKLHEKIGTVIEELYKENINQYYGVLSEHFINSENYEKGAEYSYLSAKKIYKAFGPHEAIFYIKNRIDCLEKLIQSDDVLKKIIDARTAMGIYYTELNYHMEAKAAVDPIIKPALEKNYKRRISQIYTVIGSYDYIVDEDFTGAYNHLKTALEISKELDDFASLISVNYWLGLALSFDCKFEKALTHFNQALDYVAAANLLWAISAIKSVISLFVYYNHGKIEQSIKLSNEAVRIAEESSDVYSKAIAYTSRGIANFGKGFFEQAKKYLLKAEIFCKKSNHLSWNAYSQEYLGEIYLENKEYHKSIKNNEKAIRLIEKNRIMPSWLNLNKIRFETAKVINNDKNVNLELLYIYVYQNKFKINNGWMHREIGKILLNIDDQYISEADDWIRQATEADQKNGMMFELGRDYALYSDLFKRKNDIPQAKKKLNKSINIFKECGADGWVEKYKKELAAM